MKRLRIAVVLFLLIAAPAAEGDVAKKKPRPPNVLFIAIDDLNDWVGCLDGHPKSATPNIDRLAKRGVLFTNAHCAAPACNPSRAALMTGVAPSVSGVYLNSQPWRPVMKERMTLPQHFMANGYRAVGAGKIYHGAFPDPESWDEYWPSKSRARPPDPKPDRKKRPLNGIPNSGNFDWGPLDVPDEEMSDAKVVDWVITQFEREDDRPVFLACGIFRPHLPWFVPKEYFEAVPIGSAIRPKIQVGDLDDIPAAGRRMANPKKDHHRIVAAKKWNHAIQAYLASIRFADHQVGRLLKALDESPMAANTIVVLWTDHGWHLGEKEHWRKFSLWEESTRTPLIVMVPEGTPGLAGGTKAGQRCARAVSLLDLYPTLAELCGLPERKGLSGQSLVPLLEDPKAKRERPALTTHGRGNHSVRTDRYRYIRYADGSEELYDHAVDPNEWENLATDKATSGLRAELRNWLPEKEAENAPSPEKKKRRPRK